MTVYHCLDRKISQTSTSNYSSIYLAILAAHAGLCLTWSENPEDRFFHEANIDLITRDESCLADPG